MKSVRIWATRLEIASEEFWSGIRRDEDTLDKNIISLDQKEIAETQKLLQKYGLRVTDIASPLFKPTGRGPKVKIQSSCAQFGADYPFESRQRFLSDLLQSVKPWERIGSDVSISGGLTSRTPIARQ